MGIAMARRASCWSLTLLLTLEVTAGGGCRASANAAREGAGSLWVDRLGLHLSYPQNWSVTPSGVTNAVTLTDANRTAVVSIYGEPRTSEADALRALAGVASESAAPVTRLTIDGWPALERRELVRRTQPSKGRLSPDSMVLKVTTAVAAGTRLIRLDAVLPADADQALVDQVVAMGRSLSFSSRPSPAPPR